MFTRIISIVSHTLEPSVFVYN